MEDMMRDIDGVVSRCTGDFLYLFNEYREVCSRTDLASYIVRAVSDYVFEIADELDKEEEEEQ